MHNLAWLVRFVFTTVAILAAALAILAYTFGPTHVKSYCDHTTRVFVTTQWGHDTRTGLAQYDDSCGAFTTNG